MVLDSRQISDVSEDLDEGVAVDGAGGEIDDLGGTVGFFDPGLELGVRGDDVGRRIIGGDEVFHEFLNLRHELVGIFIPREALELWAKFAVDEATGLDIVLEIVTPDYTTSVNIDLIVNLYRAPVVDSE